MLIDILGLNTTSSQHTTFHSPPAASGLNPSSNEPTAGVNLDIGLPALKHTSSTTVEIPIALLNSLLSTVDSLRKEVAILHNDLIQGIHTMSSEFETVNSNMEVCLRAKSFQTFTCFPSLPLELRRLIWNAALAIPQVITMRLDIVPLADCDTSEYQAHAAPLSVHSHLLHVNREARSEAKNVYVPSQVSAHACSLHKYNTTLANLTNDILWFPGVSEFLTLRAFISSMGVEFSQTTSPEAKPICRLAVPHTAWADYMISVFVDTDIKTTKEWVMCLMYFMTEVGVRELMLVVNDSTTSSSTDVAFVAPKRQPADSETRKEVFERLNISPQCNWNKLEASTNQFIAGIQEIRMIRRQRYLDHGMSEQRLNQRYIFLRKCVGWTPPTFRYVDAVDGRHDID